VSTAYLQFTKADCYDIYICCNQETQHELQHLATLQQQSFATAVVCTSPYVGYVVSAETDNQPRLDKEVSVVFSKNSSVDQRFKLMRFDFSHSQSFSAVFTFLFFRIAELLSSFASKMDPKRQLKIKTGVLKRYVSFAENF